MNVVFLNPVGTLGGAERSLIDVLAVLRKARPDWRLHLIAGADGPLLNEASRIGAEVDLVSFPLVFARLGDSGLGLSGGGKIARLAGLASRAVLAALGLPRYLQRLSKVIAAARPSLVHSNGIKFHLLAGHVTPSGVPVVWHVRDFLSPRPLIGKWLRRLARRPALAIANSESVRADTAKVLPKVRVECLYNGIDTDFFSPGLAEPDVLDRLAGFAPGADVVRVGLVATYAKWKGHEVFLEAASRLTAQAHETRFYIVGGPTYSTHGSQYSEAELREMIARRQLTSIVGLPSFQTDLRPIYRGLDIVVHASTKAEPFGRTVVEGMACGRAVVAMRSGGTAELFQDGVDAIGVEPGDLPGLTDAIRRLAADPLLRSQLGRHARQTAVARFSYPQMTDRLLALYDSIPAR